MDRSAGEIIRRARLEKRLSQRELARQTGIAFATLCRIERSHTRPSRRNLQAIANVLGSVIRYTEVYSPKLNGNETVTKR